MLAATTQKPCLMWQHEARCEVATAIAVRCTAALHKQGRSLSLSLGGALLLVGLGLCPIRDPMCGSCWLSLVSKPPAGPAPKFKCILGQAGLWYRAQYAGTPQRFSEAPQDVL